MRAAKAVFGDLPAQRIAVHAQKIGSSAHIALGFGEDVRDDDRWRGIVLSFDADLTRMDGAESRAGLRPPLQEP